MLVLIAGAAGFIGSHLADRYLSDGHHVIGVDNLLTGDHRNLETARNNPRFTFVQDDICGDLSALRHVLSNQGDPDLVLHFASPASPVDYGNYPLETLHVNSAGTEVLARIALECSARFLYASTSEAYGDPLEHPQKETYWGNVNPVGVRSCYDESKRYGEALVSTLVRTHGLDGRIIRIFNTYGPRMQIDDGRVVPNFVRQALAGEALTIYGDGMQTRSFCYVDDLLEGVVRCAALPQSRGLLMNLGSPQEHTIREFAEIVCRIAHVPLQTISMALPPDDPARRRPDIERARELLKWEPRIDLEDGLRRTIDYFKSVLALATAL